MAKKVKAKKQKRNAPTTKEPQRKLPPHSLRAILRQPIEEIRKDPKAKAGILNTFYLLYYGFVTSTNPYREHTGKTDAFFADYIATTSELVGTKHVPLLHIKHDSKPIKSCQDLRELWDKITIPHREDAHILGGEAFTEIADAVKAYFAYEHAENLEKIGALAWEETQAPLGKYKGQVTFQYNKRKTKEGSEKVVSGILIGEKGKHPFTKIPALAFAEYARASNAGIKDAKIIEKRVINRIPSWQKHKSKGTEPNTKYVKREIKKGIKVATNHPIIPFNPIPFHIDLPKSR